MNELKKIIKTYEENPDKLNIEGKRQMVEELVEFMSEGQMNNIIDGFKHKADKKELKK